MDDEFLLVRNCVCLITLWVKVVFISDIVYMELHDKGRLFLLLCCCKDGLITV
jgi:hypothetical protein